MVIITSIRKTCICRFLFKADTVVAVGGIENKVIWLTYRSLFVQSIAVGYMYTYPRRNITSKIHFSVETELLCQMVRT